VIILTALKVVEASTENVTEISYLTPGINRAVGIERFLWFNLIPPGKSPFGARVIRLLASTN